VAKEWLRRVRALQPGSGQQLVLGRCRRPAHQGRRAGGSIELSGSRQRWSGSKHHGNLTPSKPPEIGEFFEILKLRFVPKKSR
jgi:hypothetical protein